MKYTVERTYCDCHPETCCHFRYSLLEDGKRIQTSDDKEYLQGLADKLNS